MADVRIPTVWPTPPNETAGNWLNSTYGSFMSTIADACNQATRYKFLPCAPYNAMYQGAVHTTKAVAVNDVHRLVVHASDQAKYIALVLIYQAAEFGESGSDVTAIAAGLWMKATLKVHGTGAVLDGPDAVIWQHTPDGTLPTAVDAPVVDVLGNRFVPNTAGYPLNVVTTGIVVDDSPAALPTRPRPLNVGAGAGADVRVEIETKNVRLLHMFAIEMYTATGDG